MPESAHQDAEKDDAMIGTLVVWLPSSRSGGELVIGHGDKTVAYQAAATEVSVAAFYADCRHEVRPPPLRNTHSSPIPLSGSADGIAGLDTSRTIFMARRSQLSRVAFSKLRLASGGAHGLTA